MASCSSHHGKMVRMIQQLFSNKGHISKIPQMFPGQSSNIFQIVSRPSFQHVPDVLQGAFPIFPRGFQAKSSTLSKWFPGHNFHIPQLFSKSKLQQFAMCSGQCPNIGQIFSRSTFQHFHVVPGQLFHSFANIFQVKGLRPTY